MLNIDHELRSLIPPLKDEELRLLEHSIDREGCREPLVVWEGHGTIVDGHNRFEICRKLDVPFEVVEVGFDSKHDVIEWMCVNQLGRRNLTDAARSDLRGKRYNNEKKREGRPTKELPQSGAVSQPGPTRERIAKEEGVSKNTVDRDGEFSAALDTLEALGIERQEFTSGRRKIQKSAVKQLADTAKEDPDAARDAWKKVQQEGPSSGAIKSALRDVRNEQAAQTISRNSDELIQVHHGDFAHLSADLEPGSVDAIITDPPYPYEFIDQWTSLSTTAMRLLKPGGWCIAYSGKQHLAEVVRRMSDGGLAYFWQIIFMQTVTPTIHPRKVNTRYKPILLFQKPPITPPDAYFVDVIDGQGVEKSDHEWQQSEDGFAWLIERFTNVGDTIVEPFAGGGTVPAVAQRLGRFCIAYEIEEASYAATCRRVFDGEVA